VAVGDDQPADAGARHALADFGPQPGEGLGRQGQGAGERLVLVGLADRHQRQKRGRQIGRQPAQHLVDDTLIDARVDRDREVRSVLFDGADRQHRDHPLAVERGEIRGGHFLPELRRKLRHIRLPLLRRVTQEPCHRLLAEL
jgi:hypothetical protein